MRDDRDSRNDTAAKLHVSRAVIIVECERIAGADVALAEDDDHDEDTADVDSAA